MDKWEKELEEDITRLKKHKKFKISGIIFILLIITLSVVLCILILSLPFLFIISLSGAS